MVWNGVSVKTIIAKMRLLLRLLFPIPCYGCGLEGEWLCEVCAAKIKRARPGRCVLCGEPGRDGLCEKCVEKTGLEGVAALFPYAEPAIGQLVRGAKYSGKTTILPFLAERFAVEWLARIPIGEWVVAPTPLSKRRFRERGYNQSELLARALVRVAAQTTNPRRIRFAKLLIKTRHTAAQATLDRADRHQNLQNCFSPTTSKLPPNIILVDDVVTTGATLSEAARTLRCNGAKRVWALTVAHD